MQAEDCDYLTLLSDSETVTSLCGQDFNVMDSEFYIDSDKKDEKFPHIELEEDIGLGDFEHGSFEEVNFDFGKLLENCPSDFSQVDLSALNPQTPERNNEKKVSNGIESSNVELNIYNTLTTDSAGTVPSSEEDVKYTKVQKCESASPTKRAKQANKGRRKRPSVTSDEYRARRERNNVAVKKSREKAKLKSIETEQRVTDLQRENQDLSQRLEKLNQELSILRSLFSDAAKTIDAQKILTHKKQ